MSAADIARYVDAIRSDSDRMSACARMGPLDAPVAACPDWDLRDLVVHTATIHRWATVSIGTGAQPQRGSVAKPGPDDDLAVWLVDGASELIRTIESVDPHDPAWHPFPFDQLAWVMARRQAIETMLHRWDAETAIGRDATLDADLASEGIGEFFQMGLPRALAREGVAPPDVSLHVHCTDVDGEWLVWSDSGNYRMLPVHDKGDAAMRGRAEDLLLVLMGRRDQAAVDIVGDDAAAQNWLDLPDW